MHATKGIRRIMAGENEWNLPFQPNLLFLLCFMLFSFFVQSRIFVSLWNSYVYLGKEPNRHATDRQLGNRLGSSGAVIPRLMENLLDKGYHVYVDSKALFTYLSEHDTAA